MANGLIVHDMEAYSENGRLIDFVDTINNVKNIEPGDTLVTISKDIMKSKRYMKYRKILG